MNFPYRITPNTVTIAIDGTTHTINKSDGKFTNIVGAIKAKDWDTVRSLVDTKTRLIEWVSDSGVEISGRDAYYRGELLRSTIATRMVEQFHDGFDIGPLVRMFDNIMLNPLKDARDEVFDWVERNDIPITEDGCLLAYKKVRDDYLDVYSGTICNKPGTVVTMDRDGVDPDRRNECSTGLHFAAQSYMSAYSGDRIVVVKVNPRDIVAVPKDYNFAKARCCQYEVIGEVSGGVVSEDHKLAEKSVMTTTEEQDMKVKAGVVAKPNESMVERAKRLGVISSAGKVRVIDGKVVPLSKLTADSKLLSYDNKKLRPQIKALCDQLSAVAAPTASPKATAAFKFFDSNTLSKAQFIVAEFFGSLGYDPETKVKIDALDIIELCLILEEELGFEGGDPLDDTAFQSLESRGDVTFAELVSTFDAFFHVTEKVPTSKTSAVATTTPKTLLERMKAVGVDYIGSTSKDARVYVNAHGTVVKHSKYGVDTRSIKNAKTREKLIAFVEKLESQQAKS